VQLTGTSGDGRRRPATVRLRPTSEGPLVRTQLCPPGQRLSVDSAGRRGAKELRFISGREDIWRACVVVGEPGRAASLGVAPVHASSPCDQEISSPGGPWRRQVVAQ